MQQTILQNHKIGFMQGRLSPVVDGKIQCFPWVYWSAEFSIAQKLDIHLMEWTLDQERLYENPLMTTEGQAEILALKCQHSIDIPSLTGDCFMQAPFYKKVGKERESLLQDLRNIIAACAHVGIKFVLIPLVDNGRLENSAQEIDLIDGLKTCEVALATNGQKIIFESDYPPARLREFIARFDSHFYGINYDMGNSASLGFDPDEEFEAYRDRIDNMHVKDRILGGTTVPLGEGSADFKKIFRNLKAFGYTGNLILQTARSQNGDHAGVLTNYRDKVLTWFSEGGN